MRCITTSLSTALALGLLAAACGNSAREETPSLPAPATAGGDVNRLTDAEIQEGWRLLFDGRTLDGWRGYRQEGMPAGWQVVDGALTRVSRSTDIITTEQFRNFDLQLEWKTVAGGNSGIFYRAIEGPGPIYWYAPEYQILDDDAHADGRNALTSAGANYALHAVPRGNVKPVGEWNSTRIVVNGNHVEHWLNGTRVVEYELGSDDWKARVAASKFNDWPDYGKAPRGHIGLQGDHGWVALRGIRIRELPDS